MELLLDVRHICSSLCCTAGVLGNATTPAVRCPMKVELDTAHLSAMTSLWRDATDRKAKLSDEAKLHILANRAQVLKNMVGVAGHWQTFLQAYPAANEGLAELNAFRDELASFRQWATDGLNELQKLQLGESMADGQTQPSDDAP